MVYLYELKQSFTDNKLEIVITIILLGSIAYISTINFLLFHTLAEIFSILVACCIGIIALNTYKSNSNKSISYLGLAYGFVALFDLMHTFAYEGLNIYSNGGSNLAAQLWISARFIEAFSIFLFCYSYREKIKLWLVFITYFSVSIIIMLSIFKYEVFRVCFIPDIGLTKFKIFSEYVISIILLISMKLLYHNRSKIEKGVYMLLQASIITTILSEMAFTLYIDPFDFFNMVGHILKIISFYMIYKIVVVNNLKKPYEEILINEKKYRSMLDLLPAGIYIANSEEILYTNDSILKILGAPRGLSHEELYNYIDEEYLNIFKEIKNMVESNNVLEPIEKQLRRINGEHFFVEVLAIPCPLYGDNSNMVIVSDISERKRSEILKNTLHEQEKLLHESEEYNKQKTDFFNNLTHELRTPLNVILGTIQLLEMASKESVYDLQLEKYLRSLKQNCYRMMKLINNLLDITKLDAGFYQLQMENLNIVAIIEDITQSLSQYAEKKGVELIFDTEFEEKYVYVDPNAMERIMLNLLSNAIKFTKEGDRIIVNILGNKDSVIISVKDSGIGIPQDKLKYVFNRYKQFSRTKNTGTGIGLALVESLVKMHKGTITAKSSNGEGTEFLLKLPVKDNERVTNISCSFNVTSSLKDYVEAINIEFSDIYSI